MSGIAVIGAGLSGLCYALHCKNNCIIYEANDEPGGLCTSHLNRWGVHTDVGPHIFFSKNKELVNFFLRFTLFEEYERRNHVFCKGTFVKYPFENYIGMLPREERDYCVKAFKTKPKAKKPPETLDEYFMQTFGEGIYNLYLKPYNEKLWKRPLSELSVKIATRIPKPPMQHILDAAAGKYHEGFTQQATFKYPVMGGCLSMIQGIYASLPPNLEMRLSTEITQLHIKRNGLIDVIGNASGEKVRETYYQVVSTMPLPVLVASILPVPPKPIVSAALRLKHLGIYITAVHALQHNCRKSFAITVPHVKTCFHRVTLVDFLGKHYRPGMGSTMLVETTHNPDQGPENVEAVHKKVISGLHKLGMVASVNVLDSATRFFKYAYPVYTMNHAEDVALITGWLRERNIIPLGRFGSFEYLNMDRIYEQAKKEVK